MQQASVASLFIQAASRALTTNHPGVTGVRPQLNRLEACFFNHWNLLIARKLASVLRSQPAAAISARSCSPALLLIAPGETPMTRLKARLNAASDR